jgi:hypothetical protein
MCNVWEGCTYQSWMEKGWRGWRGSARSDRSTTRKTRSNRLKKDTPPTQRQVTVWMCGGVGPVSVLGSAELKIDVAVEEYIRCRYVHSVGG